MTKIQIGTRIVYKGDVCNAFGSGAIVAVREENPKSQTLRTNRLSYDVVLNDGRTINGVYHNNIGGDLGDKSCRFMVDDIQQSLASPEERAWLIQNAEKIRAAEKAEHVRKLEQFAEDKRKAKVAGEAMGLIPVDAWPASKPGTAAAYNLRRHLKQAGIAASVKQDGYDSLRVSLKNGNSHEKALEATQIASSYEMGHFDGMTESYHYEHTAWESVFGGVRYVFVRSMHGYSL